MAHSGFAPYSHRDFIKQLRQLLQDRYTWDGDGFTILKEVIQNANDARATRLDVGWSSPLFPADHVLSSVIRREVAFSKAPHPLLTAPALFAINDGPFSAADALNITRLGSNSKAGEATSAGRFGLGLKSVFHLCEAFFYLAAPFSGTSGRLCRVFNPWSPPPGCSEKGPYENWDFEDDDPIVAQVESAILQQLEPIVGQYRRYFCLWVPLRSSQLLNGNPSIVSGQFDERLLQRMLSGDELAVRLAELLPLLHSLAEIRIWMQGNGPIVERCAVRVAPDSVRPPRLPEPPDNQYPLPRQTLLAGRVEIQHDNAGSTCQFVGVESITASEPLQSLWGHRSWPADESLDPETNRWRDHRVKVLPHGAVRFMAAPLGAGHGRVSLHWCVFLPLGGANGEEHLETDAHIGVDVSVFLHGYFFVDSGRKRHLRMTVARSQFAELDGEKLQQEWNGEIERQVIWPYFLEALARFVVEVQWEDRRVEELTRAIQRLLAQLDAKAGDVIRTVTAHKQWLHVLKAGDQGQFEGQWKLLPAIASVYAIPPVPAEVHVIEMLPKLADLGEGRVLTLTNSPRLAASDLLPWPVSLLRKLVGSLAADVAISRIANLEYLADLLEHCAGSDDERRTVIGDAIWPVLKEALQSELWNLKEIERCASESRRLFAFVPEEHRMHLSWATGDREGAARVVRLIAADPCDVVPIPHIVRPAGRERREVSSSAVLRLLKEAAELSLPTELLADVVGDLLDRADLDRPSLASSLADLRLLVIFNCQTGQVERVTWRQCERQKEHHLLFCDQAGLTKQLQLALGDTGVVWRIDPDFAKRVLGEKHGLPGCSVRECVSTLIQGQTHLRDGLQAEWANRTELLLKLLEHLERGTPDEREKTKAACRLLLLSRLPDAAFLETLFLAAEEHFDPLAEKLVRQVLSRRIDSQTKGDEGWRIIDGESATWAMKRLNEGQRDALGLAPLTLKEPTVLDLLEKAPNHLQGLELSSDEYTKLLAEVDDSRLRLLRELPIHPTTDGRRVAILADDPPRFFWDEGYRLDPALAAHITFLRLDRRTLVSERQKRLAPVLDRDHALRLALESRNPAQHWPSILAAIHKSNDALPEDVLRSLQEKKWLPSPFGGKGRDDLIWLSSTPSSTSEPLPEDIRLHVNQLVRECDGAYIPDWMLDHDFLRKLSEAQGALEAQLWEWGVLPDEQTSLQQLGLLLSQHPLSAIGHLARDHFEDWLAVAWDGAVMPVHRVLRVVANRFSVDRCFDSVSHEIRIQIADIDRLRAILEWLVTHHEQAATFEVKRRVLRVFLTYFDAILMHPQFEGIGMLRSMKLLSEAKAWVPSTELCMPPADGITAEHLLEEQCAELLRTRGHGTAAERHGKMVEAIAGSVREPSVESQEMSDNQSDIVESYFRSWEGHLPNDVIGGFVALLGADESMQELASKYLGKRSLDETRRNVEIIPSRRFGRSQLVFDDHVAQVRIVAEGTASATNLFGDQIRVPLAADCKSLLIGFGGGRHVGVAEMHGRKILRIQLRQIEPVRQGTDRLVQLLKNAATTLLVEGFQVPRSEHLFEIVERTFQDLRESDQLEIRVTQQLILEDAELLLSQLGLQADPVFGPVISAMTQFRRLRAERSHNERRFDRRASWTEDEVEKERTKTNQQLRQLLEDDCDGQRRVLAAVRQRIQGHNQYNPAAIPFELFQNADDACEERVRLLGSSIACDGITFFARSDHLVVRHFGRCVNQVPPGIDPRSHKLADDLRKMLTLWLSNKDSADNDGADVELTGKFGLGFKSVFLITDRPRLYSGQLACEIVGGVFPRYLDVSERQSFAPYVGTLTDDLKREVTAIELPLATHSDTASDGWPLSRLFSTIGRFLKLAHLLVVFARQIRHIEIQDESTGRTFESTWHETPIPGVTHCCKGTLAPIPDFFGAGAANAHNLESSASLRALVLRTDRHAGALLFVHDGRRLQSLPNEIPTLWVTAPTCEALRVGFAVNAKFELDPGRAQLGRDSSENKQRAAVLGREFGSRLVALFEHSRKVGWTQFSRDIGLDASAEEYEFWDSLWELLGPALADLPETSDAGRILQQIFWGSDGAALALYRTCPVLPCRLKGAIFRSRLTTLSQVRFSVTGILAGDDGFTLMCVRDWPVFQSRKGDGEVISAPGVANHLRSLGYRFEQSRGMFGLAEILEWEIQDATVDPIKADWFGQLTAADSSLRCERTEEQRVLSVLRQLQFKDRTGQFQMAHRLIIGRQHSGASFQRRHDECMRAAFAPANRLLSDEYTAAGVTFFEACREKMIAPAGELAVWVLNAATDATQDAALRYLADGDLGREVQDEIKRRGGTKGTWLEMLRSSKRFRSLTSEQQGRLLSLVSRKDAEKIVNDAIDDEESRQANTHPAPSEVLRRIHEWWSAEGDRYIRRYEERTYPDGAPRHLNGERDDRFRKDWVVLFLLGLTHTMGRTVAEQHREFLRKCEHDGWLAVIASSHRDPGRWMRWIDEFLDRQVDDSRFLQWMKQFVGVYQVSRHLDVYIAAFEAVERMPRPFALTEITVLLSSPIFQGGGFEAPPLANVLGMGQCFVLRELVRNKIIRNPHAHRHCYVPVKRVRDLLTFLGCEALTQASRKWEMSRDIHSFLTEHLGSERACFGNAFDIPLQLVAEDDELLSRFVQSPVPFDDSEDDLWDSREESDKAERNTDD